MAEKKKQNNEAEPRVQRIRMRIQGTALKMDGTVISIGEFKILHKQDLRVLETIQMFTVEFDGPYEPTNFYHFAGNALVIDREPQVNWHERNGLWSYVKTLQHSAKIWEVL